MTEATIPIEDVPFDAGEIPPATDNGRGAPKATSKLGKLGANKKARSGVRALTQKDGERLAGMYVAAGMGIMPFNPKVAAAFAESADQCAEAWVNLAQQNDAVRRAILWIIEGSAAGALILAHLPIIVAAIPPERMPPMFAAMFEEVPDDPSGVTG
jgi:hypothetical protein